MTFQDSVFIGIDPTSSYKSFTYAVLDRELNIKSLTNGEMDDVLVFLRGQVRAVVAINAPAGVNRGLVKEKMKKEMRTPHKIRGMDLRLAEYELRGRGINVTGTPSNVGLCASWVQLGFDLYRELETMGFEKYPQDGNLQVMETHPHACYCVMAGGIPASRLLLEGKLQRQLLLHERGLRIKDPMDFFEEITRYKITKGILPHELLLPPEQLDALVAAYTAWLTANKQEQVMAIGDDREGMIQLPISQLKETY